MTAPPVTHALQVRTWNLPALVMYFMPLKGLYFSPYISRRFTLSPGGKKEERSKGRASLRSSSRQLSGFVLVQKRLWKRLSKEPILQSRGRQPCHLVMYICSKDYVSKQLSWEKTSSQWEGQRVKQIATRVRTKITMCFAQVIGLNE